MSNDNPAFVYAMVPVSRTAFKNFFEAGAGRKLLEDPGQLRPFGWDLTTSANARIVKGEYFEIKSAERKLLRLYEDGSFMVKVSAGEDYLSWGRNENAFKKLPRLNPLAVVEFTLNFVKLCAELVRLLEPVPPEVLLQVEVRNAFLEDAKLYLNPHDVNSEAFMFDMGGQAAQEPSMQRRIRISAVNLMDRPAESAFVLLEKIYTWFGLWSNQIPYTSNIEGVRFID